MPEGGIQVELGGDDDRGRSSSGPDGGKALWLLIGLGLGFALSFLLSSSVGQLAVGEGGPTTTSTLAPAAGTGTAIPGFPDGLNILVSPGEGRALEVLTWPQQGEPFYRSVPLGDIDLAGTAHFDASGQFLAATTSTPNGFVLRSGRPNTFGVVASGITSFAWHDSDFADLAWSKVEDDEFQIWVSEDAGPGELVAQMIGIGDVVSAFGDWGFAIEERTGGAGISSPFRTHILAPNGELRGVIDGWVVASHGSGLLLVENMDELRVVTGDAPEDGIEIRETELTGVVVGGEFSPSGDRFAVTGLDGVSVVNLETLNVTNHSIRAGSDSLSWSSDGRFLLVSAFRGVAVLDTRSGRITSILDSETTRAVAATPIGGP